MKDAKPYSVTKKFSIETGPGDNAMMSVEATYGYVGDVQLVRVRDGVSGLDVTFRPSDLRIMRDALDLAERNS